MNLSLKILPIKLFTGFAFASPASKKALKAAEDLEKVEDDLTTEEAIEFSKLAIRYAEAANKIAGNTAPATSIDMSIYGL